MGRLIKLVFWLVVLAAIAVVGYGYLGDLTPEREDISTPVELDAN